MTDVNPPAASTNYVNALAAEVLDMLDFGYLERRGPAQEADPDSEGDTDADHTLVGFAIASVVGLAGGNFVFTSRNADRHYRRESETPDPV